MGCDIHTIVEVKTSDGWVETVLDEPIFNWRCYGVFSFLAGVRNYAGIPPIFACRDWPIDATEEALSKKERWRCDAHSATYVMLNELLEFDYDQPMENRRVTKQIAPKWWDGGCTAEPGDGQMTTYREFLESGFFKELERLSKLGEPTNVRVLMFFDN